MIPGNLNRELCLCGIPYIDGPVVISSVGDVGHDPSQTVIASFVTNRYSVYIGRRLPGDSVGIPDGHHFSAVGRNYLDPPGGGIHFTGIVG